MESDIRTQQQHCSPRVYLTASWVPEIMSVSYTKSCGIMTSQIDIVTAVMRVYETGTFHFHLLQTGELEKKKEDTFRNNI